MKTKKIPISGYANVYKEKHIDVSGNVTYDYHFGNLCEKKEDLPQYYEYDCVAYKHEGVAHITIELEE